MDKTSSMVLTGNKNNSGDSVNTVLVAEGTLNNQGTITADEIKTTAPNGSHSVRVVVRCV